MQTNIRIQILKKIWKVAWIWSHHLHLQWKFKLWTGKFAWGVYLGKTLIGDVNKLFVFKSLLTTPSNVLPVHLKETFPLIIWIFTEDEGDGIESGLSFKKFLLYLIPLSTYLQRSCQRDSRWKSDFSCFRGSRSWSKWFGTPSGRGCHCDRGWYTKHCNCVWWVQFSHFKEPKYIFMIYPLDEPNTKYKY